VQVADSLKNYPTGFQIAITNPPYLASYSAKRLGIPFPKSKHDNVYKEALDVMLAATPYVAAIIPESFITQNLFHCRLQAVISLASRMFEDTETPVCLALFVPEVVKPEPTNFAIYKDNILLGTYSKLKKALAPYQGEGLDWKFNENDGLIGLRAIDSQRGPSIRFLPGEEITCPMKVSTRLLTRISGPVTSEQATLVIQVANELLESRRKRTKDTFMTAFKGLRDDGSYRRRLDYTQARDLLNLAAKKIGLI
jgi:hypothetical protein